ncbi:nucleoside triphosphate pyrophosphohydrolase [Candidatus Macondimonas diazotrophica]|jgi:MazG family protein|uniref:Nucleoside triphosphate pyrophosphohydrolase n=1 Tax=Candidatus Macondimonas diazotrophica TaxID=2305248 RepID=A0A4Z0FAR4_9GAMM|nr:nucleoside triphosphate pyrophosphohydrolase [Candidatus Macondimonas diazotrophica]NCU01795.1 nucleoside triphosphate pyrophosphohydrolase [Candidatus Macondimonas diazotrophica]TFZ82938.1 nucleoside triphosphate pyrophosphohydrolase [Candidatus Macondimonas diazotrophica]HBG32101.1 nucleoside triphosphate pyrophosphohydrolase [Gammaproteobacteria bacterium]HBG52492.1 nucleoside triphosphate pyrophosphohydrolase [Gammaproteobacteria bacterium]
MEELLRVMAQLRDPETGCPWDRDQDFRSLIPYLLEESYEVVDVLDREFPDPAALREELGDLLFQVVFHSRLAEERGWFDFSAVAAGMADKLVRRHPHVFADPNLTHDPARWERIKQGERQVSGKGDGALVDVPAALPGLMRAQKLGRRAARVGFDWGAVADIVAKVREEMDEVEQALAAQESADRVEEELGDVLFSVAQLSRFLDLDAEAALRRANAKFIRRFQWVEQALAREGLAPDPAVRARMEALWDQAKQVERNDRLPSE